MRACRRVATDGAMHQRTGPARTVTEVTFAMPIHCAVPHAALMDALMPAGLKRCTRCRDTKPIAEFYRVKDKPHSWCKPCVQASGLRWRKKNRQHCRDYTQQWQTGNIDSVR